ncbi:hypothetical protein [Acinetobacter sp. ANC 4648]|nr:hypothetical protein [Acinetobacter sp. ANC 4648]
MLKAVALLGTGIAIGCCYQSFKKDPKKSRDKNLDKVGKTAKEDEGSVKE